MSDIRILGAGLYSLVLAECFNQNGIHKSDIKLYGEFNKSSVSSKYELGPRILHKTDKVQKFLLGLNYSKEFLDKNLHKYNIKYIDESYKFIGEDKAKSYYKSDIIKNASSFGKIDSIIGWSFNELDLLNVLQEKYKYSLVNIHLNTDNISDVWKNDDQSLDLYYSTLSLNILKNLFNDKSENSEGKIEDARFIISKDLILPVEINDGDIIYDVSDRYLKRLFKPFNCDYYTYEFQSGFNNNVNKNSMIGELYMKDSNRKNILLDTVGIKVLGKGEENIYTYKNIRLIGREATGDKSQLVHNIIENILK